MEPECIWVKTISSCRLMQTRQRTFSFHRKRGNSASEEQMAASQAFDRINVLIVDLLVRFLFN
jgi:hypothetical protein